MPEKRIPAGDGEAEILRLFIAIPLPEGVRRQVAGLSERLQKGMQFTPCRPRWTNPETMHITLVFLGRTPKEKLEGIQRRMGHVGGRFKPLRFEVKQLGVFPHWRNPRVLWAGLRERTHQLEVLHTALVGSLTPLGYVPEDKAFRPHLTLARFKGQKGVRAARDVIEAHKQFRFGPFTAKEFLLYQSTLDPAGATHKVVGRYPLAQTTNETEETGDES